MRPVFSLILVVLLNQLPVSALTKQAKQTGEIASESQLNGIYLEQPSSTSEKNEEMNEQIKGEKTNLDFLEERSR